MRCLFDGLLSLKDYGGVIVGMLGMDKTLADFTARRAYSAKISSLSAQGFR